MNCPACGHQQTRVLESRIADAGDAMRRRRECLDCCERVTTYERIELPTLWVTKHDGRQEQFDRAKLLRGLAIACSKSGVGADELELIVRSVETELRSGGRKAVGSEEVGQLALAGLVRIDEAAAIRFASVIQGTGSVSGFRQVLDRMDLALVGEREAGEEGVATTSVDGGTEGTTGAAPASGQTTPPRTTAALAGVAG